MKIRVTVMDVIDGQGLRQIWSKVSAADTPDPLISL